MTTLDVIKHVFFLLAQHIFITLPDDLTRGGFTCVRCGEEGGRGRGGGDRATVDRENVTQSQKF